jgi:N-acetylmuramoyl-L-alanine amidase
MYHCLLFVFFNFLIFIIFGGDLLGAFFSMKYLLLLLFTSVLYCSCQQNAAVKPFAKITSIEVDKKFLPNNVPVIMIDAGHGGFDPGAINDSSKLQEKWVTRKLVDALIKIIDTNRVKVYQTRVGDAGTHRHERVAYANSIRPDLMLTIHINASPDTSIRGFELSYSDSTFVQVLPENGDTIKMLNPNKARLAKYVTSFENSIKQTFPQMIRRTTAVRKDDIWMIYAPKFPSILLEFGFITNNREANFLADPLTHTALAQSLRNTIYGIFFNKPPTVPQTKNSNPKKKRAA